MTNTVSTSDVSGEAGLQHRSAGFFASRLQLGGRGGPQFSILILWWLIFVAVATYILLRTRTGNWILASGGNAASARAVGVPTKWVKIGLFVFVGFSAWFYAMHQLSAYKTIQAGSGIGGEFLYIIAAVVGGCALTGGSGSADRVSNRRIHLRHDRPGHCVRRLGPELVPVLPGGRCCWCGAAQPQRQAMSASDPAMTAPMSTPIIEMIGHLQVVHPHPSPGRRRSRGSGRRGHVRARRQRRREIDPDKDHGRLSPVDSGVMKVNGEEVQFNSPRDALNAGHRDGLSRPRRGRPDGNVAQFLPGLGGAEAGAVLKPLDIAHMRATTSEQLANLGIHLDGCQSAARNALWGSTAMCRDRPGGVFRRQGADSR